MPVERGGGGEQRGELRSRLTRGAMEGGVGTGEREGGAVAAEEAATVFAAGDVEEERELGKVAELEVPEEGVPWSTMVEEPGN